MLLGLKARPSRPTSTRMVEAATRGRRAARVEEVNCIVKVVCLVTGERKKGGCIG